MSNVQIILQQSVKNLGMIGDVATVAPGYFRNYLFPRKLAFLANPKSLAQLEHQKRIVEAKKSKAKASAEEIKAKIEALKLELVYATGGGEKLFGAVTPQEIVSKLREKDFEVERKYIQMEAPIKTLGEHTVGVKLHPDVTATLKISVTRKEEDKKAQAPKEEVHKPRKKKVEIKASEEVVEEKQVKEEKAAKKSTRKTTAKKKSK